MPVSQIATSVLLGLVLFAALCMPWPQALRRSVRRFLRRRLAIFAGSVLLCAGHGAAVGQLAPVDSIHTFAGNGIRGYSGDGGPATSASMQPGGLGFDGAGNLYFADTANQVIRKIATGTGIITTVAGNGQSGYSGDGGPATSAMLYNPGMAVDVAGNLFIVDSINNVIRKVTASTGVIATIAGNGVAGKNFQLGPLAASVDSVGNFYFATNSTIFKIDASTGVVSTVAGNGIVGYSGNNGAATSAEFEGISGLAVDKAGNVYVSDSSDCVVRKINAATGIVSVVAGNGILDDTGDGGPATSAAIVRPSGLAFDSGGSLYISQPTLVRKVDAATGIITTVAGNPNSSGFSGDGGPAVQANLYFSSFLTVDRNDNLYIVDGGNYRIRQVGPFASVLAQTQVGSSTTQNLYLQTTTAETITSPLKIPASQGGKQEYMVGAITGCAVDGTTSNAAGTICTVPITFSPAYPGLRGMPLQAVTSAGDVNITLSGVGIGPQVALSPGLTSIIGGNCTTNCAAQDADGVLATSETMSLIDDLKVNRAGDIYFLGGPGVRKIDGTTGIVSTVVNAGTASLNGPQAMALDAASNIYIADYSSFGNFSLVRKINSASGVMTTIAGKGSQNNGAVVPTPGVVATTTVLPNLAEVATDASGNVYVASYSQILRIDASTDILTYVAGSPNSLGYSGDGGLATAAILNFPTGLVFDPSGNLYFSDSKNFVVRRIDAGTGNISTFAGNPSGKENEGYVGPATGTDISPQRLDIDSAGNVYISDQIDRFVGIRRVDAATNIMTTIAGNDAGRTLIDADAGRAVDGFQPQLSGFALDSLGNLIGYGAGTSSDIVKIDVSTTRINFPYTFNTQTGAVPFVGTAYPNASAETINVTNIGNAALSIVPPLVGVNPFLTGAAYTLDDPTSAGCAALSTSSASTSLAPGTSCFLAVDFKPTATTNPGQIVLTDNALNTVSTQTVTISGQGQASTSGAVVNISPTSTNFPDTQFGSSSASVAFTVSSTGSATANISGITIGGADTTSFSQSSNCGLTLASGSNCTVNVTFTPTAAGRTFNGTVSVASDDPTSPATATLTGNGLAAGSLSIAPTTQVFSSTTVSTTSGVLTSILSNTTSNAIYLSAGSLTDASDFTQSNNCNGLLAAGGTCTVSFTFTPKSAAALSSTYAINDLNHPGSPLTVLLSGTATNSPAPQAALTPAAANYGSMTAGTTSAAQTFTLSNAGSAALTITSVSLTNTTSGTFSLRSNSCSNTLAAGASCAINITFGPSAAGSFGATLSVVDAVGTQTAALSGTATAAVVSAPQAAITPTTVSYGSITLGATAAAQTIVLNNGGTAPLTITSVTLGGANAGAFTISAKTCGTSLAADTSCTVSVTFNPAAAGSFTATLSVVDAVGTQTSTLSGSAVAPAAGTADFTITATPASQSSYRGKTVAYSLQLTSLLAANPFTGAVTLSATGLPSGATVSFAPATVVLGASQATTSTMTVTIPGLVSQDKDKAYSPSVPQGLTFAAGVVGLALGFSRRKSMPRLLPIVLLLIGLAGATAGITGCGTGNGFAVPTSTANITVTATSGSTVHSTNVTLTIQ